MVFKSETVLKVAEIFKGLRNLPDIRIALGCPDEKEEALSDKLTNASLEGCWPFINGFYPSNILYQRAFNKIDGILSEKLTDLLKKPEEQQTLEEFVFINSHALNGMRVKPKIAGEISVFLSKKLFSMYDVAGCLDIWLEAHCHCPESGLKQEATRRAYELAKTIQDYKNVALKASSVIFEQCIMRIAGMIEKDESPVPG